MNKFYIKKFMFFLIFLLVTTSFDYVHGVKMQEKTIDILDQENGGVGCGGCEGATPMLITDGYYYAQSFTPSHNVLSRVKLFLKKSGTPPIGMKLTLFIRETPDGDNLASIEKEIEGCEFINFFFDLDIQDINVIPGNMYYMVIMTHDVCTDNNGYGWYSTNENPYSKGSFWTSYNMIKWSENEECDMFFQTYWKDYGPDTPTIEGSNNGVAQKRYDYTFSTIDPEGDDVEYYIKWDDGKEFKWTGPYKSGEQVIKSHSWTYEGNYTISVIARDTYGAESDLATFDVYLIKSKEIGISLFLQKLFQRFPFFEKIIKQ